jgi:hypothetical protein
MRSPTVRGRRPAPTLPMPRGMIAMLVAANATTLPILELAPPRVSEPRRRPPGPRGAQPAPGPARPPAPVPTSTGRHHRLT